MTRSHAAEAAPGAPDGLWASRSGRAEPPGPPPCCVPLARPSRGSVAAVESGDADSSTLAVALRATLSCAWGPRDGCVRPALPHAGGGTYCTPVPSPGPGQCIRLGAGGGRGGVRLVDRVSGGLAWQVPSAVVNGLRSSKKKKKKKGHLSVGRLPRPPPWPLGFCHPALQPTFPDTASFRKGVLLLIVSRASSGRQGLKPKARSVLTR